MRLKTFRERNLWTSSLKELLASLYGLVRGTLIWICELECLEHSLFCKLTLSEGKHEWELMTWVEIKSDAWTAEPHRCPECELLKVTSSEVTLEFSSVPETTLENVKRTDSRYTLQVCILTLWMATNDSCVLLAAGSCDYLRVYVQPLVFVPVVPPPRPRTPSPQAPVRKLPWGLSALTSFRV